MTEIDLSGKVAVVTGAAAGLGRAEAVGLARAGATVVVNDMAGALDNSDVLDEIAAAGAEGVAVAGDISVRSTADELVATADSLGGLGIVVNNAGITRDRILFNMSDEEWDAVIAVHLRGHFLLTRNAATYWRQKAKAGDGTVYGRIINTSSEAGLSGPVGQPNYGAAKAGITALTLSAARALERGGGLRRGARADRRAGRPVVARARRHAGAILGLARRGSGQRAAVHRLWSNCHVGCATHGAAAVHGGFCCVGPGGAQWDTERLLC